MAILAPQEFKTKKGRTVSFRNMAANEGAVLNQFMQQIARESQNTYQVPGRLVFSDEEQSVQLQKDIEHTATLNLGVYFQNNLVGALFFYSRQFTHPWAKHIGGFGMMILKEFWGEGIGKELLRMMEEHARPLGITRIEAQVRSFNENGIALYKNAGYQIEGTRRKAAFIDGKFHDEFHIGKLLDEKYPKWTPPTLETERLILRAITLEDAPAIFEYASQETVSRYTLWEPHKTIQDSVSMIKNYCFEHYHQQEPEPFAIVLKSDPSKMIGTAGASWISQKSQCMEMGAALSEKYWGKGIMTEAQSEVMRYCFEEYSRDIHPVNRIQGHCKAENIASAKMIQKTGRQLEAIHRQRVFSKNRFWDMKVYAILRDDWLKTRNGK